MAISPSSPPGVQRERLSKRWWRSKAIGGRSRTALRRRRTSLVSITREQILAWLAPPRFLGDARLRHDGGDPPSRQSTAAQKNETPNGKNKSIAIPSLIRWSI